MRTGEILRDARIAMGLSLREAARALSLPVVELGERERGVAVLGYDTLTSMIGVLGRSIRERGDQLVADLAGVVSQRDEMLKAQAAPEVAVAAAVQAEREACAQIVEAYPHAFRFDDTAEVAAAIRARGSR